MSPGNRYHCVGEEDGTQDYVGKTTTKRVKVTRSLKTYHDSTDEGVKLGPVEGRERSSKRGTFYTSTRSE